MKHSNAVSHLEKMIVEITGQLVDEQVAWETCRSTAEDALQLIELAGTTQPDDEADRTLEELKEKFNGVLNYRPGHAAELSEDLQYQRYYLILTLDSTKKLLAFLRSTGQS